MKKKNRKILCLTNKNPKIKLTKIKSPKIKKLKKPRKYKKYKKCRSLKIQNREF